MCTSFYTQNINSYTTIMKSISYWLVIYREDSPINIRSKNTSYEPTSVKTATVSGEHNTNCNVLVVNTKN